MPRTPPAALDTHYQGSSLTLATGLEFERADGVKFHFTDLDQDITVNGFLHLSAVGYDRTAISNSGLFKLDDIDIVGFFADAGIPLDDFRQGRFDHAKWCLYIFNFESPGDGIDVIGTGRLGGVIAQPDGTYRIQLHRINEKPATHIIGKRYSNMCRVDVGSSRLDLGTEACTVPIEPAERGSLQTYAAGDFMKVQTLGGPPLACVVPIVNGDFETGDMTGWTTNSGNPTVITNDSGLFPQAGTYFLRGFNDVNTTTTTHSIEQNILVSTIPGWVQSQADNGLYTLEITAYRATADALGSLTGRILCEIYDVNSNLIQTIFDDSTVYPDDDTWYERSGSAIIVPNAYSVRVFYSVTATAVTTRMAASLDSLAVTVHKPAQFARISTPAGLLNPDFELGEDGSWAIDDVGGVARSGNYFGLDPVTGSWHLTGNAGETSYQRSQVVDLSLQTLFDPVQNDAGDYELVFSGWQGNADASDLGQMTVQALDSGQSLLSTLFQSSLQTFAEDTYTQIVAPSGTTFPSGTRYLKVILYAERVSAPNLPVCFDSITLQFLRTTEFLSYDLYEDRIYEATNAGVTATTQPVFNTSVGATTGDGSVTWKAYEAWTRFAEVTFVTSNGQFDISLTDTRAIDDWFNDGYVRFDSGDNFGHVQEIRDYTDTGAGSSGEVELFIPMPFDVEIGDLLRIAPGCKKTRTACRNDWIMVDSINFANGNVLNFQGEPDLPGRDTVLRVGSTITDSS